VAGEKKGVPVPGLANLRKRAGLSQEELAQRSGVGRATISRLERGANGYYDTISRLARALKTSRRRLIGDAFDQPTGHESGASAQASNEELEGC
jgi:transcriptional regulator with XRE-family HTH domain